MSSSETLLKQICRFCSHKCSQNPLSPMLCSLPCNKTFKSVNKDKEPEQWGRYLACRLFSRCVLNCIRLNTRNQITNWAPMWRIFLIWDLNCNTYIPLGKTSQPSYPKATALPLELKQNLHQLTEAALAIYPVSRLQATTGESHFNPLVIYNHWDFRALLFF